MMQVRRISLSPASRKRRRHQGFSLIELLIVLAVVGILAAIAYPSYQESVRKSRRADASGALLELAQFMERTFVENKTYTPGGANPALPYTEAPKDESTKFYDLALTAATATTFTLTATPKNDQAVDSCGKLTYTNTAQKGIADAAVGKTVSDCW